MIIIVNNRMDSRQREQVSTCVVCFYGRRNTFYLGGIKFKMRMIR